MRVDYGSGADIDRWMELVRAVRAEFPGLETGDALKEHGQTVLRFMNENRALCVKDGENVVGVLLFSVKHNMICCLAVSPEYRKRGVASAMLEKALSLLDAARDITVDTFCEDDPRGPAARALYAKYGFAPDGYVTNFGCRNQRFVLRRHSAAL